jgi:hypothetical protein
VRPSDSGCAQASPEKLRKAAAETLRGRAELTQAAWIAPGAPRPE